MVKFFIGGIGTKGSDVRMNKKGITIAFEKVIILIVILIVFIAVFVFVKSSLKDLIDIFMNFIKQIFKY